jgi:hypothetical protein
LNGAIPILRELIGFDGVVGCEQQPDSAMVRLRGTARGGSAAAEVWFSGVSFAAAPASGPALPAVLQRVSVFELALEPASRRAFRIETSVGSFELHAGSVQVHRDAAREFFGAVPPLRVPRATRLGWALLLTLLRMPGAVRLLAKLRG